LRGRIVFHDDFFVRIQEAIMCAVYFSSREVSCVLVL
jgi:hypothetical protein